MLLQVILSGADTIEKEYMLLVNQIKVIADRIESPNDDYEKMNSIKPLWNFKDALNTLKNVTIIEHRIVCFNTEYLHIEWRKEMKKRTVKKITTAATAAAVISSNLIAGVGTVVHAEELPNAKADEKADAEVKEPASKKDALEAAKKKQAETQAKEDTAKKEMEKATAESDAAKVAADDAQKAADDAVADEYYFYHVLISP